MGLMTFHFLFTTDCALEKIQQLTVDIGQNVTLPCKNPGDKEDVTASAVEWIYEGSTGQGRRQSNRIRPDGSLALVRLHRDDAGIYECSIEPDATIKTRVKVKVRSEFSKFLIHTSIMD